MGVSAANIGKARLQVLLMDNSPFKGKTQQEFAYYLNKDVLASMQSVKNTEALPDPFNGVRVTESMNNYDNYLIDTKEVSLENPAVPKQGQVLTDSLATFRAQRAGQLRNPTAEQVKFFTWQVSQNLFEISSVNPAPVSFAEAELKNDNTPKWTYNLKERPNATNPSPLSPFMISTTSSPSLAVHWGCRMISTMARNQPFEILFYHEGQVHTIAEEALSLIPRFQNLPNEANGQPLDLTKKGYLALETGIGSLFNLLFLFVQGMSPMCFAIEKNTLTLISEFTDYDGANLFSPINSFFSVKFEPVSSGILVTSDNFGGKYWAVQGSFQNPIFIGEGPLAIYSGNVQAGFAMRPVQYMSFGSFSTDSAGISIEPGDNRVPIATTALKGTGDIQQQIDSNNNAHAVDAEIVNGQKIKTFFELESSQRSFLAGLRKIDLNVTKVSVDQEDVAFGPPAASNSKFIINVLLTPTDSTQPGGYVIKNGRSPYLWQFRAELPIVAEGSAPGISEDISCDVLGLELTWNATSFNELVHTGTLRIQNRPRNRPIDYRNLTNGAVYLKINAWWDNGAGHDPGTDNRQIFEGLTTGATVETKAEQEVVVFKIEDYMNVLTGSKFMNSPYYDGMKASLAVTDIVRQTGLGESSIMIGNIQASTAGDDPQEYGLPIGPNPLAQPMFKFQEGSPYKDAIVKIATLDGKVIYFDQQGRFHYDPIPGGAFFDEDTSPIVNFVSSPRSTTDGSLVVWNSVSFSRAINDVYNVIRIATVDKETGIRILLGDSYDSGISDPKSQGYLGYRKRLDIFEPALGGLKEAARYFYTYRTRVFLPPLVAKFETYGYSGLKPLDTITLDGSKIRIVNISLRFDPKDNLYFMNIEGEWYFNSEKQENPGLVALEAAQ